MDRLLLAEAPGSLNDAQMTQAVKGRFRALLIRAGWGSSGYYSEEVLRRDGPKAWPAGTANYLDHPTIEETRERPERSVKDWASVIVTDPVWDPVERGLVAEIQVFPQWRELLNEDFVGRVGLSIRAYGTAEHGEAEGREGPIVTSLSEGLSVDWVTRAGAGGRVLELIESARKDQALAEARNVGQWLESRLHLSFTQITDDMFGEGRLSRDERVSLSSAIGDALDAFTARVTTEAPQLYQRDLWDGPPSGEEDDAEMTEATQPADEPTDVAPEEGPAKEENTPGEAPADDDKEEGAMPEITEEQARQLEEAASVRAELEDAKAQLAEAKTKIEAGEAVAARVTDLENRLAEADARNLRLENDRAARTQIAEALKSSGLPERAHARVTESVCRTLPTTEDGALDAKALGEAITRAIDDEKAYLAALAEESGIGTPRGLGSTPAAAPPADLDAALAEAFTGLGLDEQSATIAANGR